MAYAAAVSLLQILKHLQESDQFSMAHYQKSQIHHLQGKICSLKDFIEKNSSLEDNSMPMINLERQIRDAIYEAEEMIESHMSSHFLASGSASSREENHMSTFFKVLQRVIQNINSIAEQAEKFTAEDMIESRMSSHFLASGSASSREENHMSTFFEDLQGVIQNINSIAEQAEKFTAPPDGHFVVGRTKDILHLVDRLRGSTLALEVVPIVGIRGIGKTTLATVVYNDQIITSEFGIRAWIKVSHEYHKRDVLLGLLRSMEALGGGQRQETDDQLAKYLHDSLRSKKYLLVFDDVCGVAAWNDLKELLADCNNGSRVILTTRDMDVAHFANNGEPLREVCELPEKDSGVLLSQMLFPYELCPEMEQVARNPKLRQVTKNIASKCRGLPLAIVIIGGVLAKAGIRGWQTAASSISVSRNHDELVEVVLSLNFRSLPQYLKACLLYMGILPHKYGIPTQNSSSWGLLKDFLN